MIQGISEKNEAKILNLFKDFSEVDQVILYGSRALGTFHNGSDIDITLIGQKLTMNILLRIERGYDDLMLPYKADISILGHISNPDLLVHIDTKGICIYKKLLGA